MRKPRNLTKEELKELDSIKQIYLRIKKHYQKRDFVMNYKMIDIVNIVLSLIEKRKSNKCTTKMLKIALEQHEKMVDSYHLWFDSFIQDAPKL